MQITPSTYTTAATLTDRTSPECALSMFGRRIGEPVPAAQRMYIDYDGLPPAPGVSASVVVSRPPDGSTFLLGALQLGFPGYYGAPNLPQSPLAMPDGLVLWCVENPAIVNIPVDPSSPPSSGVYWSHGTILRFALPPFPSSLPSLTMTAQFVGLLGSAVPGGYAPSCTPNTATGVASPALWVNY